MLDFRRNLRTRNYLSRREQRHLFWLVIPIGLVILVGLRLAELVWTEGPSATAATPVDTRLPPIEASGDPPDAFISPRASQPPREPSGRYFPGVQPEFLAAVRDDSVFRDAERNAWFNLCDVLGQTTAEQLEAASSGKVEFVQLFRQPDAYRGELVTVRGTLRRLNFQPERGNLHGVAGYFVGCVFPESDPVVVYSLDVPPEFPRGMELAEEVEVTGFFFKRWAFAAPHDEIRAAPLLLAKTIRWLKPAAAAAVASSESILRNVVLGAVAGVVALLALGLWLARPASSRGKISRPAVDPADLNALADLPVQTVQESLRQLATGGQATPKRHSP